MSPDQMSNEELFDVLRTLLNRQPDAARLATREFPSGGRGFDSLDFSPDDLAALRPYVVSMRQGRWDTTGIFNSTSSDVDAIFGEHARSAIEALDPGKKFKIVLYAHGGLVSEKNGLAQAQFHINWWKQSAADGIYPLYFVWKTGLGETVAQLLGLAGSISRELARAWISDPVVAAIARRLGGEAIWSGMKRDAEQAVLPDGVATYVARKLKEFCDRYPGRVELHAIGHSAGSIFHSHFIPLSTVTENPFFTTTSFLAPAVTVDTFLNLLTMPAPTGTRVIKPEVGHLALFTMKKDFEQNDNCIDIYHQSLLYLVYHAFEPGTPTPILGLEESLRGNSQVASLLGLGGAPTANAEVIWSKSPAVDGCSATQAIHHGDFSSDAPTMNSVIRRILNRCNGEPIHPFPQARALTDMWDIWAPPDDLPGFSVSGESLGGPQPATTSPSQRPSAPQSTADTSQSAGRGKRKALCVGINAYAPPNRLTGCVNDANTWASLLQGNGFQTRMLLDGEADYDAIMSALRDLVGSSQSGDILVFQYSGHGTTVPDLTNRTVDGIEEAMVPVDFSAQNPKLLMDFDIGAIFNGLLAGVNLTCFIDCCHSGTILRLFGGSSAQSTPGTDERARFIVLSDEEIAAVQSFNMALGATARGNVLGGQQLMREVAFAACRPEEVALEVNGQGEFTRFATGVLSRGFKQLTNEQFQDLVTQAFGPAPRQHPTLDCADPARTRPLLQPL